MQNSHTSVFLNEAVRELGINHGSLYIDATFGEGGHAQKIVDAGGIVLGIDADPVQARKQDKIRVVQGNFADIETIARSQSFIPVHGVLFDFGLSMEQLLRGGKGLSYHADDEEIDMRLNPDEISAHDYLNTVSENQMIDDFMKYSEDIYAEPIAKAVCRARRKGRIQMVRDLKNAINSVVSHERTKSYARIFQAIRIVVNDEIEVIKKGIAGALSILVTGGHIVIITFHSLEDRTVKKFISSNKEIIGKRIDVSKERLIYPFERSAQLRVITKL